MEKEDGKESGIAGILHQPPAPWSKVHSSRGCGAIWVLFLRRVLHLLRSRGGGGAGWQSTATNSSPSTDILLQNKNRGKISVEQDQAMVVALCIMC